MPQSQQFTGQNQSLIELIVAIKGMAQTLEYMHSDLRRMLEDDSRDRDRDIEQLKELLGKNQQTLTVMPMAISDRVEVIISKLSQRIEDTADNKVSTAIEDVRASLCDVSNKLRQYTTERQLESDMKVKIELAAQSLPPDVSGKIEIKNDGQVELRGRFQGSTLAKVYRVCRVIVIGLIYLGSAVGFTKVIFDLFR